MRGDENNQRSLFTFIDLEERVGPEHPLRPIKVMCDRALVEMSPIFDQIYSKNGRPSIPPEQLLRALLLQVLYSVRSERRLVEEIEFNLLYRWFIGLRMDEKVWHASTFTQNRERLLEHEVAWEFSERILRQAREQRLLSNEHFTVDGTYIEAWASHKSFQPKAKDKDPNQGGGGRNANVDFSGQKRSNKTHASTTDPEARLRAKGGDGAKMVHHGHVVTDNRHGLVVATLVDIAEGNAEPEAAVQMLTKLGLTRGTVGADKGYDQAYMVEQLRQLGLTPHLAQNTKNRSSAIDGRTTRHPGYAISQRRRKRVEEVFGWLKVVGLLRKTRHVGKRLVGWMFTFSCAVYNLVRMRTLLYQQGAAA